MNIWNKIRIAYVEDQPGMRNAVCSFLNSNPDVTVVFDTDNGNELLTYMQQHVPLPSICIIDISMPKMDGLTLLAMIRKTWRKLPCLIYSMHSNEQTILKAIHLGTNGYLSKKYGYDELFKAVLSIINTGIAYTPDADSRMFEMVTSQTIKVPLLSERERLFIRLAGSELSYMQIAVAMEISEKTVDNYRSKCFKKLNVTTRVGLTLQAIKLGIIHI